MHIACQLYRNPDGYTTETVQYDSLCALFNCMFKYILDKATPVSYNFKKRHMCRFSKGGTYERIHIESMAGS